jgi:hypothetical protein
VTEVDHRRRKRAPDKPAEARGLAPSTGEPTPELGQAMRALHPRWQRAVTALFLTNGDRTKALRLAGYQGKAESLRVMASRLFADDRVRAAIREEASKNIDVAEPEMLGTTLSILRNVGERASDRLAAVRMIWDRSNPVVSKHKLEITHHLSNDERDIQHYRALKKLGATPDAFVARFGPHGIARVQALILAEEAKHREIEGDTIEAEYAVVQESVALTTKLGETAFDEDML